MGVICNFEPMKQIILILTLFSTTILFGQKKVEVEKNKNIEFISLCSWLIDFGSNYDNNLSTTDWNIQNFQIKKYLEFKKFKDDPLLDSFRKADKNEGLSRYIYLFSQLKDFPKCKLEKELKNEYYLRYDDSLSDEQAKLFTEKVIQDLNSFYKKINFNNFWESNSNYYDKMIEEVEKSLPNTSFITLMEDYYQQEFKGYKLIPSLMMPSGMGFGPTLNNVSYNFFGSFNGVDKKFTTFGFDSKDKLIELTTHEFGHSFVNHLVDELTDSIYIKETEILFQPIKKSMWKQGYREWKTSLNEHFVRAGEIIIAKNLGNLELEIKLKEKYLTERNFIYLPIILRHLNYYNENREKLHYIDAMKYALDDLKNYR